MARAPVGRIRTAGSYLLDIGMQFEHSCGRQRSIIAFCGRSAPLGGNTRDRTERKHTSVFLHKIQLDKHRDELRNTSSLIRSSN